MSDETSAHGSASSGLTYAESGVDIEAGDTMARMIQRTMHRTHGPRVLDRPGGFAGLFRLDYNERLFRRNYKDPVLVSSTDGVGSKLNIASALGIHDTVGIDCVAMCVNDMIVEGAEPLFFLDYIGVHALDPEWAASIVTGVAEGCRQASCALIGGETAELPSVYPPGEYDLVGFSVGVVELDRAIDASRVEVGDVVIGLRSSGVHSNGFSLVRKIIDHAGLDLHTVYPELDTEQTLGQVLLTPTRIYARPIVRLLRRYKVKKIVSGMAHITGGGLPNNLNRALHAGVDARLDATAWEPNPIFSFLQKHGKVDIEEMRRVFNMGIGYVLIVRPSFASSVVKQLTRLREDPVIMGEIVRGDGRVIHQS